MLQRKQGNKQGYLPISNRAPSPNTSRPAAVQQTTRKGSPDVARRNPPQRPPPQNVVQQQLASGKSSFRDREKFVPLPDEVGGPKVEGEVLVLAPTIFEDLEQPQVAGLRGRITIFCVSDGLDRKLLEAKLKSRHSNFLLHQYPDVLYGQYWRPGMEAPLGDIFYFDYGVVAFWGLSEKEEQDVMQNLVSPCELQPLPQRDIEIDEFQFVYSMTERPHIQNDTITINHKQATEHLTKLAICFALSQSTKLVVYEEQVMAIVQSTRTLPSQLANTGKIHLSRKQIAQLIGKVFIQKSAVNLLSTVLDTPEFFWSAPDSFQTLYKKVCEYLEYDTRVEVLNNRFQVLQEMLDMLRDHQNTHHTARLEWIVIWLIVVEVLVGLLEVAGLFGWIGRE